MIWQYVENQSEADFKVWDLEPKPDGSDSETSAGLIRGALMAAFMPCANLPALAGSH